MSLMNLKTPAVVSKKLYLQAMKNCRTTNTSVRICHSLVKDSYWQILPL